MPFSPSPERMSSRSRIAVVAVGLVVVAVGVYGSVRSESADSAAMSSSAAGRSTQTPAAAFSQAAARPAGRLPRTNDPIVYTTAVAEALLAWDTTTAPTPAAYATQVLDDADPRHIETGGLTADVLNYLPTAQAWQHLGDYQTRQSLTIEHARVPETWDDAAVTATGRVAESTIAVSIEGVVHREGVWNGQPVAADHDINFTVFVACAPAFDRCHTLRLSAPGKHL